MNLHNDMIFFFKNYKFKIEQLQFLGIKKKPRTRIFSIYYSPFLHFLKAIHFRRYLEQSHRILQYFLHEILVDSLLK